MVLNADQLGGPTTGLHDPRVTTVGRFLRKFKLDELPQLINVLKADMSLVGPRAEVPQYTDLFQGDEKLILTVRPGITDLSSLEFNALDEAVGSENPDDVFEKHVLPLKNALRVKYVKERSFGKDLSILFKTFAILFRRGFGVRQNHVGYSGSNLKAREPHNLPLL